jgi:hypothetical protein
MALKVRPLTAQEAHALTRFASSRTAPHRVVQRAQIIGASAQGDAVPAMARQKLDCRPCGSAPGSTAFIGMAHRLSRRAARGASAPA